jgi:phospholipase C
MSLFTGAVLAVLFLSRPAIAGSLKDIEHIVIFMQENRSWNNVCSWQLHLHPGGKALIDKHSTLARWQESGGSMTPTCRSTQMVYQSGISEYHKLIKGCHWQENS